MLTMSIIAGTSGRFGTTRQMRSIDRSMRHTLGERSYTDSDYDSSRVLST